ncbi:MAG: nucleotide exchange factor GrpE [Pseudomonadota bacterium]
MSGMKEEEFLDDIEQAEAEEAIHAEEDLPASLEEQIEDLVAERDAFQDKFMRALADAENSRKRAQKERSDSERYGGAKLARDVLPVFDNLKRAVESVTDEQRESSSALIEGIELTMRELLNVFSKHGMEVIDPQVGDKFDPQLHEAMFEAPLPGTKAGEIIQVSAQGFMLHDRILRPAQVGVSSNPG